RQHERKVPMKKHILFVFLAAGLAHAQPAQDPGIAESPPPPAPAPPPPPAPPPAAVAPPAVHGSANTLPPAERPVPPPAVDESVSVKVDWVDKDEGPKAGGELDQH